jgi:hypothetical protein
VGVVLLGMLNSLITLAFLRYVDAMAVVVVSYVRNIVVVVSESHRHVYIGQLKPSSRC